MWYTWRNKMPFLGNVYYSIRLLVPNYAFRTISQSYKAPEMVIEKLFAKCSKWSKLKVILKYGSTCLQAKKMTHQLLCQTPVSRNIKRLKWHFKGFLWATEIPIIYITVKRLLTHALNGKVGIKQMMNIWNRTMCVLLAPGKWLGHTKTISNAAINWQY